MRSSTRAWVSPAGGTAAVLMEAASVSRATRGMVVKSSIRVPASIAEHMGAVLAAHVLVTMTTLERFALLHPKLVQTSTLCVVVAVATGTVIVCVTAIATGQPMDAPSPNTLTKVDEDVGVL